MTTRRGGKGDDINDGGGPPFLREMRKMGRLFVSIKGLLLPVVSRFTRMGKVKLKKIYIISCCQAGESGRISPNTEKVSRDPTSKGPSLTL